LGHVISEEGIAVDPKNIEAIKGWTSTKNVTKFKSFMVLSSYYRRFIVGFSRISHPITSLQRKGVKFQWTTECEKRLQQLKQLLTRAQILRISYPYEYFVVFTDA
jgi:hypothetical protein